MKNLGFQKHCKTGAHRVSLSDLSGGGGRRQIFVVDCKQRRRVSKMIFLQGETLWYLSAGREGGGDLMIFVFDGKQT